MILRIGGKYKGNNCIIVELDCVIFSTKRL